MINSKTDGQSTVHKANQNDTISLKHIFLILLNKIWLIILVLIIGGVTAFSYAKFILPLTYQSYTSMYVKSTSQTQITSGSASGVDITAARSLVSTYIAVLQDDAVMDKLSAELIKKYGEDRISEVFYVEDGQIPASTLSSCISLASVDDTEVFKITVTTTDAQMSADVCNTFAEIAPDFLIRVVGAGSVEEIGSAKVNEDPVSPNIPKLTMIGALIGAILAAGVIIVIDFCDNTVKDSAKLVEKYNKAIIGEVQNFDYDRKKSRKKNKGSEKRILLTDSKTPFFIIESYKAMRTNIRFALAASDKKIFAISSSNESEGKSTTSSNVAIALSQTGNKILLIDGDMRKPVVHKIFKLKNKQGLSSVISKMSEVEDCISKDVVTNLDVLTSGVKPPNPSELLASPEMKKMLKRLAADYDYIIIDTPPVNVVSDAVGLGKNVAGIFVVLKYGETTYDDVEDTMNKIGLSDMNMLGFIINDINRKDRSGSYYRYGRHDYGYEYSYGSDTENDSDTEEIETEIETGSDIKELDTSVEAVSDESSENNLDNNSEEGKEV